MSKIKITVESDDNELTDRLVKLLSQTQFKSAYTLEIVSTESFQSKSDSVFFTQHQINNIFFRYQFDGIKQTYNPDELNDLEFFATTYSDFAIQAMMHNDEFKNLFSGDLSSAMQTNANLVYTNPLVDSTAYDSSFFYPTTKYASYHKKNDNAENKTGAFFALGLGLCAVSGILFVFAPLPLAITSIILTIALLGMAVFYNELKEFAVQDNDETHLTLLY